jgi:hypothetical protein
MAENELHAIVSDMHSELTSLDTADRSIHREFESPVVEQSGKLEISASLLRLQPAMTLFVSRIKQEETVQTAE